MQGNYFHTECHGCNSYGIECNIGCEYGDDPDRRTCFTPKVEENYEEHFEEEENCEEYGEEEIKEIKF